MIVSVICLFITPVLNNDAYNNFIELSQQLDNSIEWIDHKGSLRKTRKEAAFLLNQYVENSAQLEFKIRHNSNWKNDQCFKIIHIKSQEGGVRVYFQCHKKSIDQSVVTKIKISDL